MRDGKMSDLDESFYEYHKGRWMCPNDGSAFDIMEKHPGDPIYTFERDKDDHIINIVPFWTPSMPEKTEDKLPNIRNGKMRR
jgi:hypothetical protein